MYYSGTLVCLGAIILSAVETPSQRLSLKFLVPVNTSL